MENQEVSNPDPFSAPNQFPESRQQEHTGDIPNGNTYSTPVANPSDLSPPNQLTEPQQKEHTGEIPNGNAYEAPQHQEHAGEIPNSNAYETPDPDPSDLHSPNQFPVPQQSENTGEIPNGSAFESLVPDPSDVPPLQQLTETEQFPPSTAQPYVPPAGLQPVTSYPPQRSYYIAAPLPQQPNQQQQLQQVHK